MVKVTVLNVGGKKTTESEMKNNILDTVETCTFSVSSLSNFSVLSARCMTDSGIKRLLTHAGVTEKYLRLAHFRRWSDQNILLGRKSQQVPSFHEHYDSIVRWIRLSQTVILLKVWFQCVGR